MLNSIKKKSQEISFEDERIKLKVDGIALSAELMDLVEYAELHLNNYISEFIKANLDTYTNRKALHNRLSDVFADNQKYAEFILVNKKAAFRIEQVIKSGGDGEFVKRIVNDSLFSVKSHLILCRYTDTPVELRSIDKSNNKHYLVRLSSYLTEGLLPLLSYMTFLIAR